MFHGASPADHLSDVLIGGRLDEWLELFTYCAVFHHRDMPTLAVSAIRGEPSIVENSVNYFVINGLVGPLAARKCGAHYLGKFHRQTVAVVKVC